MRGVREAREMRGVRDVPDRERSGKGERVWGVGGVR